MENDLADEGLFWEFDSIFDEEDLVENQTNHTPSKQQIETEGNMSSVCLFIFYFFRKMLRLS